MNSKKEKKKIVSGHSLSALSSLFDNIRPQTIEKIIHEINHFELVIYIIVVKLTV